MAKKKQAKKKASKKTVKSNGKEKKKATPPPDLEKLKEPVIKAMAESVRAENEANALNMQARVGLSVARKAYAKALAPYREACKKAGVHCEFGGAHSEPVSERVSFDVKKVEKGVRVMVKGRPETGEVIPTKTLKESVNKAAYAYTEKHLGPKEEIGNKGGSLGNRLRKALAGR